MGLFSLLAGVFGDPTKRTLQEPIPPADEVSTGQTNTGSGSRGQSGQAERTPRNKDPEMDHEQRPMPLGTYVPAEIKRDFKARCAVLGIEMQHGATEAP